MGAWRHEKVEGGVVVCFVLFFCWFVLVVYPCIRTLTYTGTGEEGTGGQGGGRHTAKTKS